ncbi:EPIDERMAL PATTERNING FACTOR-like protein 8 [Eucalyptus grandis]|uniref:EPIDERMAL PATTERNING FACTOR-like protein 8 n=1 Tax=Eucalyptus grandis TaxID=71139 RepID=UPI00192EAA5A|nr:EPIDERMAL PATTERNING FACTOR-like protein 8 [Eucalyptus grandis]
MVSRAMASLSDSLYHHRGLKAAVILACFLLCFTPITVGEGTKVLKNRREMVGSRPPICVNRCLSCRPCMATLVIHPPAGRGGGAGDARASSHEGSDSYYLLAWKCKCGNKLYQP